MKPKRKLLFVCTGNTCRSYMAETIAKGYLKEKGLDAVLEIVSAGTGCLDNEPASVQARTVMAEMGYANNNHRAKRLTADLIREADLILTMTQRQRSDVLALVPEAREKVFLLKEYVISPEEARKRSEEIAALRQEIQKAEREFYQQHREVIDNLEQREKQLRQELAEVERELAQWDYRLSQVAKEQKEQLASLEAELYSLDVVDPFGQPVEYYRECAREIAPLVSMALDRYLKK